MNRDRLMELPAATELLREIRHMHDDAFAELSPDELGNAVRWLRAAAYSANEGARRLEAVLRSRTTNEQDNPCTSDPATTPASTATAELPPADPPPDPSSPSHAKTTDPG